MKISKMKKDFNRVYIGYTVYSLYLYLLYSTEEEIDNTFFFIGEGIHKSICEKLENKHYFSDDLYEPKNKISGLFYRICLRYQSRRKWSFLTKSQIFAQDHFFFSAALIGKRNYTLIEDAPNVFLRHRDGLNKIKKTPAQIIFDLNNLFRKFIENSYSGPMGDNAQCRSVLMTNIESDPILSNKQIIQVNETEYWRRSSEAKKNKILTVFNITPEDLIQLKKRKVIVFTQNFASLGFLPEEELVDVYAERISKYPPDEIIIKKHALDRVDYRKYFPSAYVFDKNVPMQLLNLLDIRYETAITICSSAVLSFPYEINIDWIGTTGNANLFAALGKHELEAYFNNSKP